MKTIILPSIYFIITIILMISCVDKINLDKVSETLPMKLVVEGGITNEIKSHVVKLTMSHSFLSDSPPEAVTGAVVSIDDGNNIFALYEVMPGVYATDRLVKGEIGRTYTLTIKSNGKIYSASDVMPLPVEFNEGDNVVKPYKTIFGNTKDGYTIEYPLVTYGAIIPIKTELTVSNPPPEDPYAKASFYFFSGIDAEGLIPIMTTLKFMSGDTVTQNKAVLSEEHYQFLRAFVLDTKYYGGVLSSVPSNVPTNLNNGAIGFFSASSVVSRKFSLK